MKDYYVVPTLEAEETLIQAINASGAFPAMGKRNGVVNTDPDSMTTCWVEQGREMITGERAIPRIPEARLDAVDYPQESRDQFLALLASLGGEIRALSTTDFPTITEEEV